MFGKTPSLRVFLVNTRKASLEELFFKQLELSNLPHKTILKKLTPPQIFSVNNLRIVKFDGKASMVESIFIKET